MYIDRPIFNILHNQRANQKITILIGSRQVGKTTLLQALYDSLRKENPCLFLDFDLFSNYEKARTYDNLISSLKLEGYRLKQKRRFFLFLDEFQHYADVSMVLKNIADHHPNIKIYATGSSSLGIKSNIQETLAGRKRTVNIYPLCFEEYLHFIQAQELMERFKNIAGISSKHLNQLVPELYQAFEAYLVFGGYPEVALADKEEKKEVLNSIFDLYVKKELVDYLQVEKVKNAKMLIQYLAVNNGNLTKYNALGQAAGLDDKTVRNYIEILEETFLIKVLKPWFTNRNHEIVKMPKVYYLDNGVRNYFVNNFNPAELRQDAAFLFEGYVISELIKLGVDPDTMRYWRTKNQTEVDLVLESSGKTIPIEIKFNKKASHTDLKGLKKFHHIYPLADQAYLINLYDNTDLGSVKLVSPFGLDVIAGLC